MIIVLNDGQISQREQTVEDYAIAAATVQQAIVPHSVTKLQLVRALRAADLKAAFDGALAAAVQSDATISEDWELAVAVLRADPLVEQIGAAMGLSAGDVDELFLAAGAM